MSAAVTGSLADDLAWWRAHQGPDADRAALAALRDRLRAWKDQHDRDRAAQPGPFLKMAWDGVFGDDDEQVSSALRDIEAALGR